MNKSQFLELNDKDRLGRILKGTMFYSSVHAPNMSGVKKFNSDPYFIVNLGLSTEEAAKAKSYGLNVLPPENEINMPFVKIKRKVSKGKTPDRDPKTGVAPEVVDTMQRPIPSDVLIGNGSEGILKFATYWYDQGGGGVGTALYKVQVTKLIPYVRKDKDFVTDGSGYVAPDATDTTELSSDEFEGDPLPWETEQQAATQ